MYSLSSDGKRANARLLALGLQHEKALIARVQIKSPVYRPRLVRHRIACYAARAAGESWFCRTAAGVWNPCRSMSQVVL